MNITSQNPMNTQASKPVVKDPVTEALRVYLAAGWDANWEVVAGRMYRALVNQKPVEGEDGTPC